MLTCCEFLNSTTKNMSVFLQTYKHLRAKRVYTERKKKRLLYRSWQLLGLKNISSDIKLLILRKQQKIQVTQLSV